MTEDHAPDGRDASGRSWRRILIALYVLGLLALAGASLLRGFAGRSWFADLFTHFSLQQFALAVALVIAAALLRSWRCAVLALPFVMGYAAVLAPYVPRPWSTPPQTLTVQESSTLLVWNVYVGNRRQADVLAVIRERRADLVILQEVNAQLAQELESLRDLYPEIRTAPSEDAFGIAVLSRRSVPSLGIQQIGTELRNTVVVSLADDVTVIGAHTLPPAGAWYSQIRNQQLQELAEFTASQSGPVLVAGDLNVTPWSPYFEQLLADGRLSDPRRQRGLLCSWPVNRPLIRIPIDHVLPSAGVRIDELEVLPDACGSDHFPVFCRWSVR